MMNGKAQFVFTPKQNKSATSCVKLDNITVHIIPMKPILGIARNNLKSCGDSSTDSPI